jgi:hypothetical protein
VKIIVAVRALPGVGGGGLGAWNSSDGGQT